MSKSSFQTVESHEKGDKSGYHVFVNEPNFFAVVNAEQAEFIVGASKALSNFRKEWKANHEGWAEGIELDYVPVLTDGMVMGYMVISEIDGETYDYAPAVQIKEEGK